MALSYTIFAYWLVDFRSGAEAFFYFLLDLWISLYMAESLVMVVASIVPWYLIGIAVTAATYGMFLLVNGYFILKKNIPEGWEAIISQFNASLSTLFYHSGFIIYHSKSTPWKVPF
jgi:ABC-type multidrug transport system permease subunit